VAGSDAKGAWWRVFDMDETFSAEKGADRCNFPRKENAGSAERTAKTPSTLVEA
jgi:hypothetical protein